MAAAAPMTSLTGTGGPDFFRTLNLMGWQKDWTSSMPVYGNQAHVVANAVPNPVLLTGLKVGVTKEEVEAATRPFGEVRPFAFRAKRPARALTRATFCRHAHSWLTSSFLSVPRLPPCGSRTWRTR